MHVDNTDEQTALDSAFSELRKNQEIVEIAQRLSFYAAARVLKAWHAMQGRMPVGKLYLKDKPPRWIDYETDPQLAIQGKDLTILRRALTESDDSTDDQFQWALDGASEGLLPEGLRFRLCVRPLGYTRGPSSVVILTYRISPSSQ